MLTIIMQCLAGNFRYAKIAKISMLNANNHNAKMLMLSNVHHVCYLRHKKTVRPLIFEEYDRKQMLNRSKI